ncbi:DNA mismatch repair protein [Aquimixticola soesokkakensis]|uniref:DNA mismatch repair protein n=1 Tax=Aquimixticola soesokkakensis TaxID=1519096 RepID=A0A1Y5SZD4_9RHOB|nr:ATP-binding protein [Aquimixticola soesokkakensis]SLN51864.1 DNA mismatch repair protein [Aquimixticola soesokkakensis]
MTDHFVESEVTYQEVRPNAGALIESLRDIGYTMSSALADIVDNSLSADATKIAIKVASDPDDAAIGIIDNGVGMSAPELLEAMRPGSRSPTEAREAEDLGRFGLGLKTASFSQCRRLTVVTRRENVVSVAIWDLDVVVAKNAWVVEIRPSADGIRFADLVGHEGTLILWEKLDRVGLELGSQNFLRVMDEASRHLELVFHRFMKSEKGRKAVSFELNGRNLVPVDPFAEWHDATIRQAEDRRVVNGSTVTIQPFVLPHRNKVDSEVEWKKMGLWDGHMKSQGFYLYRNRRLIRHATWFRMAPQHRLTQLARVRIDIGNESDADWKIDVLKASASPPPAIRDYLRKLIEGLGGKSKQVYRKRGAKLTDENPLPLWQRTKTDNRISYTLNEDHPMVAAFAATLTEDQENALGGILRLIAAGLPIEALYHDMAENYTDIRQECLDEAEIRVSGLKLIDQLRKMGHDDRDIMAMLKVVPPYAGNERIISELLDQQKAGK